MNKANNERRQNTIRKIQRAYLSLVVNRSDVDSITVSDVCKKAGINRTTFYSIYFDITDLIEAVRQEMIGEFLAYFPDEVETQSHSFNFNRLFASIKENQIFYKIYFKMGFDFRREFLPKDLSDMDMWREYFRDVEDLEYHIDFFTAGITAIVKKWLNEGCPGDPERMGRILVNEYQKKNTI